LGFLKKLLCYNFNVKLCKKCGFEKPLDSFYKNKNLKSGLGSYCKVCSKSYYYSNRQTAPTPDKKVCKKCNLELTSDKFYGRAHTKDGLSTRCRSCLVKASVSSRFKLSLEEYELLLSKGCDACGSFDGLCIDHDHSCCPGQVTCGKCLRGVLCNSCNTAEGFIKTIEQANGLIRYMKEKGLI
jgi:hypothetical protein